MQEDDFLSNTNDDDILSQEAFESFFFGEESQAVNEDFIGSTQSYVEALEFPSEDLFSCELFQDTNPTSVEEDSMKRIQHQLDAWEKTPIIVKTEPNEAKLHRFKRMCHLRGKYQIGTALSDKLANHAFLVNSMVEEEWLEQVCQELLPKNEEQLGILQNAVGTVATTASHKDAFEVTVKQKDPQSLQNWNVSSDSTSATVRRSNRASVPSRKSKSVTTTVISTKNDDVRSSSTVPNKVTSNPTIATSPQPSSAILPDPVFSSTANTVTTSLPQNYYTAKQQPVELPSGTDAESKRQRRLIRNRLSAALHRERKREVIDTLQKQVISRDETIVQLQQTVLQHQRTSQELQEQLNVLKQYFGSDRIEQVLSLSSTAAATSNSNMTCVSSDDVSSVSSSSSSHSSTSTTTIPNAKHKRRRVSSNPAGMVVLASTMATALCVCLFAPSFFGAPTSTMEITYYTPSSSLSHQEHESYRRRLSTSTSASSDTYASSTVRSSKKKGNDFVLSPLELHPDLWNTSKDTLGPWIGTRGTQQLYDYEYQTSTTSANSSASASASASASSNNFMFCPDAVTNVSPQFLHVTNIPPSYWVYDHDSDATTSSSSTRKSETNHVVPTPSPAPKAKDSDRMKEQQSYFTAPTHHRSVSSNNAAISSSSAVAGAPYMKLLLPASAFYNANEQFGNKNHRSHSTNEEFPDEVEQPWIELGCEIKDARILDGVDFIMAS
jgi:hypothetical protein